MAALPLTPPKVGVVTGLVEHDLAGKHLDKMISSVAVVVVMVLGEM